MKTKKNDGSKKIAKLAKCILYETIGDYLHTSEEDTRKVLMMDNMEFYVSEDVSFNYLIYIDTVMRKANIEKKLQLKIDSIITSLFELNNTVDKNPLYEVLNKITNELIKEMSITEYFKMARKLILSTKYCFLLNPLLLMFDYLYAPEQIIFGEDNQKPILKPFDIKIDGIQLPLVICLSSSWDNMDLENQSSQKTFKMVQKYISSANPRLVKLFINTDSYSLENFMCGLSTYYRQNSVFNKFMFNNCDPTPMYQIEEYAIIERHFEHNYEDVKIMLNNMLFQVDKNILKSRKYIYHDTILDDLGLGIMGDETDDFNIPLLSDFRIRECAVKYFDEEYYIVYFSYKMKNYIRTVPYLADDFYALNGGLGCTDLNNTFLLFALYDVLDKCEECFSDKEGFEKLFQPFKEIGEEFHNMTINSIDGTAKRNCTHYKQHCGEIKVEAFIRRLPSGQRASDSAIELAKQYNITLDEGKTIVSSHIRNKNKN